MSAPVDEAVEAHRRVGAERVAPRGVRTCRKPDAALPDVTLHTCSSTTNPRRAQPDTDPLRTVPDPLPHKTPAAEQPAAEARPAARAFRALRTHFGTLAGTAIMGVLVWRLGTGVFLDGLRRVDALTLVAALAIGAVTTVFSAWRWCVVARGLGIRLPLGPAVADYYRALFLNAALPGGVLGDVHRAVRHGQSSGDMGRGVRAVVLERTAGQVALAVVGVTVLLTQPSPVLAQTRRVAALLGLAVLGALAIWAAVRMGRTTGPSRRGRALRALLVEARGALLGRGNWPAVVISSVAVLAGYVATFLLAARVAGTGASVAELVPLAVLALLAMALPLNVGGWGPREGVTAWSFAAAGLGASQGLTVAVVYGVLSFAAALPGVLVLVARWYMGLRAKRARQEEATTERYAPNDSTSPARSSLPFTADAIEGRPMTPDSV